MENFMEKLAEAGITGTAAAIAINERNTELKKEIAELKARCTWKRALEVTPPVDDFVLVKDGRGVMKTMFEVIGKKLFYLSDDGQAYFKATADTFWTEYPDMPEEK